MGRSQISLYSLLRLIFHFFPLQLASVSGLPNPPLSLISAFPSPFFTFQNPEMIVEILHGGYFNLFFLSSVLISLYFFSISHISPVTVPLLANCKNQKKQITRFLYLANNSWRTT